MRVISSLISSGPSPSTEAAASSVRGVRAGRARSDRLVSGELVLSALLALRRALLRALPVELPDVAVLVLLVLEARPPVVVVVVLGAVAWPRPWPRTTAGVTSERTLAWSAAAPAWSSSSIARKSNGDRAGAAAARPVPERWPVQGESAAGSCKHFSRARCTRVKRGVGQRAYRRRCRSSRRACGWGPAWRRAAARQQRQRAPFSLAVKRRNVTKKKA